MQTQLRENNLVCDVKSCFMHLFIPLVETDFHIYYSKLLYTTISFFKYFWISLDLLEFFSIHSEGTHCITAGFHSDARRTIFSQQFLQ